MTTVRLAAGFGLLALLLAGCSTGPGGGGTLGGSFPGSLTASTIGRGLDASAQRAAREAEYRALEYGRTGAPTSWKEGNGHGDVVPGAAYKVNAYDCRDFVHTITIGNGQAQSARATACRQPNGTWQPVT